LVVLNARVEPLEGRSRLFRLNGPLNAPCGVEENPVMESMNNTLNPTLLLAAPTVRSEARSESRSEESADPDVVTVRRACGRGEYDAARLRFLRLREPSQVRLLEDIPRSEAVRLAGGLPSYTVARLCERVPKTLRRAIVQALPEGKRHGVSVILDYRRRI
jgi:hypothetical protein